ncbi:hypothetical protein BpHYR1_044159 [Brachionus plicatilis]|uniref:Uncharacterized protein n=1 Tax=Brachionus plicatilis TaxID=10195 RepID=A0A3M7T122_BRAPC|nr:hypothetical protein BpHYR1_044159 [Brachionus plicatilis]
MTYSHKKKHKIGSIYGLIDFIYWRNFLNNFLLFSKCLFDTIARYWLKKKSQKIAQKKDSNFYGLYLISIFQLTGRKVIISKKQVVVVVNNAVGDLSLQVVAHVDAPL